MVSHDVGDIIINSPFLQMTFENELAFVYKMLAYSTTSLSAKVLSLVFMLQELVGLRFVSLQTRTRKGRLSKLQAAKRLLRNTHRVLTIINRVPVLVLHADSFSSGSIDSETMMM